MAAADVVIMDDGLSHIAESVRPSRKMHAVLWRNSGLALGIKAVFPLLAVFGHASMWMAVFADVGASCGSYSTDCACCAGCAEPPVNSR